jgi:hypothetical protein
VIFVPFRFEAFPAAKDHRVGRVVRIGSRGEAFDEQLGGAHRKREANGPPMIDDCIHGCREKAFEENVPRRNADSCLSFFLPFLSRYLFCWRVRVYAREGRYERRYITRYVTLFVTREGRCERRYSNAFRNARVRLTFSKSGLPKGVGGLRRLGLQPEYNHANLLL